MEKFLYPENAPLAFSRAEKHILDYLNGVLPGSKPNIETIEQLKAGNLKIMPYRKSLRFTVPTAQGNLIELLLGSTSAVRGQIPKEFDKGMLPKNSLLSIANARVGWASDTTAATPRADIDYANIVDSWPAALRNGDLIWIQMSDIKFDLEASAFGVKAASQHPAVTGDGFNFDTPLLLEGGKQQYFNLNCPENVVTPSAANTNYFLEFSMAGAFLLATR